MNGSGGIPEDLIEAIRGGRAVQGAIGARIVAALRPRLATGSRGPGTRDAEAHDLILRGRAEYHLSTLRNLASALAHFERATEIDPDFAEARAWQSYRRSPSHVFAWPGSYETLDVASALARKAAASIGLENAEVRYAGGRR